MGHIWPFLKSQKQVNRKQQSKSERHGADLSQQLKISIRLYALNKVGMSVRFRVLPAVAVVDRRVIQAHRDDLL